VPCGIPKAESFILQTCQKVPAMAEHIPKTFEMPIGAIPKHQVARRNSETRETLTNLRARNMKLIALQAV
jgi:hypothetical protein